MSIDLDDTTECPIGGACHTCGAVDDLVVATSSTPVGVHCSTLCERCADKGDTRLDSWGEAVAEVWRHCGHLGISADQMAALIDAERDSVESWLMFAQRQREVVDERAYMHFGVQRWVEMCYGGDVVQVLCVEDNAGAYWGWIPSDDDIPTMIQPRPGMFEMQFTYGSAAEVGAGRGRIVRLNVIA